MNEFDIMTESPLNMDRDDMHGCITSLRMQVQVLRAQLQRLASILHANADDVEALYSAARIAMAGIGDDEARADIAKGAEAFPAFAELHRHLDDALLYELERHEKLRSEFLELTVDQFKAMKEADYKPTHLDYWDDVSDGTDIFKANGIIGFFARLFRRGMHS